mmetsp:Transcript_14680/g.35454  ORF Transcript_14680/g.35454 Transcript_14680/m.35454 type:complete len:162 (-) Transcript_14680:1119-1604(-)
MQPSLPTMTRSAKRLCSLRESRGGAEEPRLIIDELEGRNRGLQTEFEEWNVSMSRLNAKLEQAEIAKMELQSRLEEEQFKRCADVKRAHAEAAKERAELEAEFAIELKRQTRKNNRLSHGSQHMMHQYRESPKTATKGSLMQRSRPETRIAPQRLARSMQR